MCLTGKFAPAGLGANFVERSDGTKCDKEIIGFEAVVSFLFPNFLKLHQLFP